MTELNCIHAATGLCEMCAAANAADPGAWLDYGDHARGIANWDALQADMASGASSPRAAVCEADEEF